jgi:hypothetical protein
LIKNRNFSKINKTHEKSLKNLKKFNISDDEITNAIESISTNNEYEKEYSKESSNEKDLNNSIDISSNEREKGSFSELCSEDETEVIYLF